MSQKLNILCFDLSQNSRSTQFLAVSLTIFGFHLVQGYMHELIFKLDGFKPFSMFLTLIQFFIYAFLAALESLVKNNFNLSRVFRRKIGIRTYYLISLLSMATMGLSNTAVAYLNFPTFNMFKSCKLIPVMIGSIIILGKKYNFYDKLAVVCMTIGLIFFTLADTEVNPNFELFGVVTVCGALIADAIIGNVQEKAMNKAGSSNVEMVLYSYSIGFVYIFIWEIAVSQNFFKAVQFCAMHPQKTYGYIFVYSVFGYFGVNSVLTLVKHFGALVAVTVTTFRKSITIVLSFILFSKPFTFQYVWSGLIVLLGIYLNLYSKNKKSWDMFFASKFFSRRRAHGLRMNV